MAASERYTIISADSHAGGTHAAVPRVPRPEVPRRLRRVARQVQEPVQGPARQPPASATGTTRCASAAAEPTASSPRSCSPTPCRRSSRASCCSPARPSPRSTSIGSPGIRAHNRWLVDFCADFPERRAGIGQIFVNDVDDAIDDAAAGSRSTACAAASLMPEHPARRARGSSPLYDPVYDPLWASCEELDIPVNAHGGTGSPNYGKVPAAPAALHHRGRLLLAAPVRAPAALGRVRAVPEAQVRDDRDGCGVAAAACCADLDRRSPGSARPARPASCATATSTSCRSRRPSTSSRTAGSGVSQPGPDDAAASHECSASTGSCGAATTRTTRAPTRSPASTCASCSHDTPEDELQQILAGNAAELYDFDLDALAPFAEKFGPDGRRDLASRSPSCPRTPTRRSSPASAATRTEPLLGPEPSAWRSVWDPENLDSGGDQPVGDVADDLGELGQQVAVDARRAPEHGDLAAGHRVGEAEQRDVVATAAPAAAPRARAAA